MVSGKQFFDFRIKYFAHSAEQINKIGACFKSIAKELGLSKAA